MLFQVFCQHGHVETEKRFELRIMLDDLPLEHTHHFYWEWKTNQPASSPRELQVSESELGVQVQAWSQKSHANGHLQSGGNHLFEQTLQGKMTSKQNGHDSCHISCLFPICKAAVTSLSCSFQNLFPPQNRPTPLPLSCVAWIQVIPWNPMKRTVRSFLQPPFWVRDLSPSSTFSMCKGSWRDSGTVFAQLAQNHMATWNSHDWPNQHTLVQIIRVTGNVWLFSTTFPSPPSRWFFPLTRKHTDIMTWRWRCEREHKATMCSGVLRVAP